MIYNVRVCDWCGKENSEKEERNVMKIKLLNGNYEEYFDLCESCYNYVFKFAESKRKENFIGIKYDDIVVELDRILKCVTPKEKLRKKVQSLLDEYKISSFKYLEPKQYSYVYRKLLKIR